MNARDPFTAGYLQALYFTDTGGDSSIPEGAELAPEAFEACARDCAAFQVATAATLAAACHRLGYTLAEAGRDFWHSRNGHGTGFWDRPELGVLGNMLHSAAKRFGDVGTYAGDDGRIYVE